MEADSAAPIVQDVERAGIQADHFRMCKFENENAPGFDLVVDGIQRYAEAAPDTIKRRWEAEKDERAAQRNFVADEIHPGRMPSPSPDPSQQLYPPGKVPKYCYYSRAAL